MQIEPGSIAWYTERLNSEHASLTRQLTRTYADEDHTFTVERVDRKLSERTSAAIHRDWERRKEHRLEVWGIDSALWAIEEYQLGHYTHAFRGYVQAIGYFAQLGRTPDHLGCIRNALEAVTEYVVARESNCRCGVHLIDCKGHETLRDS